MQTVVETPAFLHDARTLGLPEGERLAMVNEKTDLTPKERQALKAILTKIVDVNRGKGKSQ